MTAPIPNSNSNSSWNGIGSSRAAASRYNTTVPRGFTQYGTAQTGTQLVRSLANAPQSPNDRLLTNAVLRRTARLRELLIENGMDPKLATSKALAQLDTFLEPNIRQVTRSVAVKQMRATAAASVQAQRERAAAASRAAKTFAAERAQAMKQRGAAMAAQARRSRNGIARGAAAARASMARGSQSMWQGTTKAATSAAAAMAAQARRGRNGIIGGARRSRNGIARGAAAARASIARGGQAVWQGTTKAATSAAAAMAAEARRSRNGIVGGARSTARVFDSRIVAPINVGVVRPVRGAAYERRVEKILAEMSQLMRTRNVLLKRGAPQGRNVDRVRKINAALNALNAQKKRINANWTNKNKKAAGWTWLKKFGRRA